jgi:hypothetical protein
MLKPGITLSSGFVIERCFSDFVQMFEELYSVNPTTSMQLELEFLLTRSLFSIVLHVLNGRMIYIVITIDHFL